MLGEEAKDAQTARSLSEAQATHASLAAEVRGAGEEVQADPPEGRRAPQRNLDAARRPRRREGRSRWASTARPRCCPMIPDALRPGPQAGHRQGPEAAAGDFAVVLKEATVLVRRARMVRRGPALADRRDQREEARDGDGSGRRVLGVPARTSPRPRPRLRRAGPEALRGHRPPHRGDRQPRSRGRPSPLPPDDRRRSSSRGCGSRGEVIAYYSKDPRNSDGIVHPFLTFNVASAGPLFIDPKQVLPGSDESPQSLLARDLSPSLPRDPDPRVVGQGHGDPGEEGGGRPPHRLAPAAGAPQGFDADCQGRQRRTGLRRWSPSPGRLPTRTSTTTSPGWTPTTSRANIARPKATDAITALPRWKSVEDEAAEARRRFAEDIASIPTPIGRLARGKNKQWECRPIPGLKPPDGPADLLVVVPVKDHGEWRTHRRGGAGRLPRIVGPPAGRAGRGADHLRPAEGRAGTALRPRADRSMAPEHGPLHLLLDQGPHLHHVDQRGRCPAVLEELRC